MEVSQKWAGADQIWLCLYDRRTIFERKESLEWKQDCDFGKGGQISKASPIFSSLPEKRVKSWIRLKVIWEVSLRGIISSLFVRVNQKVIEPDWWRIGRERRRRGWRRRRKKEKIKDKEEQKGKELKKEKKKEQKEK